MRPIIPFIIVAAGACDLLIGLERLPPLEGATDAAVDAGDASEALAPRFCETVDGSYFCDDFDDADAALGSQWNGAPGFKNSPYVEGIWEASRVSPDPQKSPPYALEIAATQDDPKINPGYVLFNIFGGAFGGRDIDADAVELRAAIRLLAAVDARPPLDAGDGGDTDAGPAPRLGVLGIVAIVESPVEGQQFDGAQLALTPKSIILGAGSIIQGGNELRKAVTSIEFNVIGFSGEGWLTLSLALGRRDAVVRRAREANAIEPKCPADAPAVAAIWTEFPRGRLVCIAVTDALASLAKRPLAPAAGLIVSDLGSARVQIDNVRFDPIR